MIKVIMGWFARKMERIIRRMGADVFFKRIYKFWGWYSNARVKTQLNLVDYKEGLCTLNYDEISYLLRVCPTESIEVNAMLSRVWEYSHVKTIDVLLKGKKGVFLDIGSHVGTITIPLALKHPQIQFVCIEANPHVRKRLLYNLGINRIENVTVYPYLCSEKSQGKIKFYAQKPSLKSANIGLSSTKNINLQDYEELEVNTLSVDDLIQKDYPGQPVLGIKLDVQGHEYEVLSGSQKTLHQHRPFLVCEFEGYQYDDAQLESKKLNQFFEAYNYTLYATNFELFDFKPQLSLSKDYVGDYLAIAPSSIPIK